MQGEGEEDEDLMQEELLLAAPAREEDATDRASTLARSSCFVRAETWWWPAGERPGGLDLGPRV